MLDDVRLLGRYAQRLHGYLRRPYSVPECHAIIREGLATREESFLDLAEHGIFADPRSPYRRLFLHAGIESGDLRALVRAQGVDGAIDALYEAGVFVTHAELRGQVPVRRGSLSFDFHVQDTRNAMHQAVVEVRSGGSRGPGRAAFQNVDSWASDAAYVGAFLSAFGLLGRPAAVWYPAPPITSGIGNVLSLAKLRMPIERWFLPFPFSAQPDRAKSVALLAATLAASRMAGTPVPVPRGLPSERAHELAAWAAEKRLAHRPAFVAATPSGAARICTVAAERGLDISGTFFRMGGEPFTPAKARLLTDVGAAGACHYYNGEVGGLTGIACAHPAEPGDVHLCAHRLALRTRDVAIGSRSVPALCVTTIHPATRMIAVNLVTDDFAVVEERDCGCELSSLGLRTHLHTIRSFEKLTGDGVTFFGEPLIELVERVLPQRFGGGMTDYQLVEQEVDGITRLTLRVHPRIGPVSEAEVVEAALTHLAAKGDAAGATVWRMSGVIAVRREEPEQTQMGKVLPLALATGAQPSAELRQ